MRTTTIIIFILAGMMLSCVNSNKPRTGEALPQTVADRKSLQRSVLKQVARQAIIPMYQQFYDHSVLLHQNVSAFCLKPTQKQFNQVRNDWSQTLSAWLKTDALLFGPAIEDQLDFSIYFYPVKKNIINKLLSAEKEVTSEVVDQAGVAGQGLATIEYLLFDRQKSSKKILESFQAKTGKQRCNYLRATAFLLKQRAKTIYDTWRPEQGNYAEAFNRAGLDSLIYTEAQQPWAELVNKLFQSAEKISSTRLALPLGKKNNSQAKPYKLEAWRSGHTLANIQASLQGLENLFSAGLLSWLNQNRHQTTVQKLTLAFADLDQEQLPANDLFILLQSNPSAIETFYQKTKVLTQIIKYDFAAAMGVQLGFNDNDGD